MKLSGMSWTASSDSEDGAPRWGRISDQRARTLALMAGFAAFWLVARSLPWRLISGLSIQPA